MKQKSWLMHPFVLFASVWLGVLGLYVMRLSEVLTATDAQVYSAVSLILIPYVAALIAIAIYFGLAPKIKISRTHLLAATDGGEDLIHLKRRLKKWLIVWMVMSAIEVVISGGVPLLWIFTGSSKSYFDFGLHSLHGLLISMILALGLCYTGLFAKFGNRRYLLCSLGIVAWSILLITRSMLIVNCLQTGMVIVLYRGVPTKIAIRLVAVVLIVVIGFGMIGDFRSGADNFRGLAKPTEAYPNWLPSGVLWMYIYLTTPLNNLAFTISTANPENNILFRNTAAPLFPSVVRNLLYPDSLATSLSGNLVVAEFNVSTAYVGPFQDFGPFGIACFSFMVAVLGGFYWRRNNLRDRLIYIVVGQCLLITVFFNHFFSLPIITQIAWIYLFFADSKSVAKLRQPQSIAIEA